jgi:hypothetical protein
VSENRVKTFREEEHELIDACRMGHGTMYDQDDLADVVAALAVECENRERNERAEMKRADEYQDAYRAAAAELERVTAALREIAEYEEPWPQDPSDVYEHFQVIARAALAGGARAAQEGEA